MIQAMTPQETIEVVNLCSQTSELDVEEDVVVVIETENEPRLDAKLRGKRTIARDVAPAAKRAKSESCAAPKTVQDAEAPYAPSLVRWRRENAPCLLANTYSEEKDDPTGWWLSEKLDGLRACWNGSELLSRNGKVFPAPKSFLETLPSDLALDGELFLGRGKFRETTSAVKKTGQETWHASLRYNVFDSPTLHPLGFEDRHRKLLERFGPDKKHPRITIVPQTRCTGRAHLEKTLDEITKSGGEGVMLRAPQSVYEPRRSNTLLKAKRFFDAEGEVIAHEKGKGRNAGRLGALVVRMACGQTFKVGSGFTDADRNKPPAIGTIVTYRFQELSTKSGKPRFPTFVSICVDKDVASDAVVPAAAK
ncbi:DNA ligase 4 [Hondaea fermentalgiana]|uniref:DNA ligase 4 n=1 Tax=Hondaea fermentalgiana TaxID=2315210 RepID=A0A2R5GGV1_9STRA|nr:DNA ligase 4 [Hondaea fermentalgiana]|eukprot:GBG30136.1 DNA ligase 4 [Hondaea fermentalgiana]